MTWAYFAVTEPRRFLVIDLTMNSWYPTVRCEALCLTGKA